MVMARGTRVSIAAVGMLAILMLCGCGGGDNGPDPTPTARVQIMLVDAPASRIEELHVKLDSVQVARRSMGTITLLRADQLPAETDLIAAGRNPVLLGTVDIPAGTYTFARLGIDGTSPVNRVRLSDGSVHSFVGFDQRPQLGAHLNGSFRVVAGQDMTLLFDVAAAASVRETPAGWVLAPQVFSQYIERGVQFGGLEGVISTSDGSPLEPRDGQVLGVFLRSQGTGEMISVAEVCCETGEYVMPKLVPGVYRLRVQYADTEWLPVGEPLLDGGIVRVAAGPRTVASFQISQ